MAKAEALPAGIAAKALMPAKAKASASTEAQKRQRLSSIGALNASTVTPPASSEEITKPKALPSAETSAEAQKRKCTSNIGASSGSASKVELDMDGSGKARGKRVRIQKDYVRPKLWSEEGYAVEVEGQKVEPLVPSPVITFGEMAREAIEARDQAIVRMKAECIVRYLAMEAADMARTAARAYLSPSRSEGSDSGSGSGSGSDSGSDSDSDTESEVIGI